MRYRNKRTLVLGTLDTLLHLLLLCLRALLPTFAPPSPSPRHCGNTSKAKFKKIHPEQIGIAAEPRTSPPAVSWDPPRKTARKASMLPYPHITAMASSYKSFQECSLLPPKPGTEETYHQGSWTGVVCQGS